ncbi:MAG: serine/threonine-protein kinase [bacterium]
MQGEFIGSYRILKKIGAGGTAQVYLAVHKDVPNLKVILKILSDERLGERFRAEADKLALLDGHPNICRIKHFFTHEDDTVIAMEFIDGLTLDEHIKSQTRLPVPAALQIASSVLDILDFAHRKGVCHRDIKPSNIMIDSRGQTKIIDFGIAKAESDPNLTAVGTACGTPTYMAPEQFNPNAETNYELVDIYAVGCTLYTMLTGAVPFTGDNPFAIRDAKLFEDPPSPRFANPDIPEEVERTILKALARDPSQRFQSAREMISALGANDSWSPTTTTPGLGPDDATQELGVTEAAGSTAMSPGKTGKNKTGLYAILGGLAAVVVALVLYFGLGGDGTSSDIPGNAKDQTTGGDTGLDSTALLVTGLIDISVSPRGDIYIDDSLVAEGEAATNLEYEAGRHVIRVENSASIEKRHIDTVYVAEGFGVTRDYSFSFPAPPKPEPKPVLGKIMIWSRPRDATIYIDGKKQDLLTPMTFDVEAGSHSVRVEASVEGVLRQADTTIIVKSDSTHKFNPDLRGN